MAGRRRSFGLGRHLNRGSFAFAFLWGAVVAGLAILPIVIIIDAGKISLLANCLPVGALAAGAVEGVRRLYKAGFPENGGRWSPFTGGVLGLIAGGIVEVAYGVGCLWAWRATTGPTDGVWEGISFMMMIVPLEFVGCLVGLAYGLMVALPPKRIDGDGTDHGEGLVPPGGVMSGRR